MAMRRGDLAWVSEALGMRAQDARGRVFSTISMGQKT